MSTATTTHFVEALIPHQTLNRRSFISRNFLLRFRNGGGGGGCRSSASSLRAVDKRSNRIQGNGSDMPSSNYVVPMDKAGPSVMTRPLVEILRDLNKRVPDNVVKAEDNSIPWYHANRLLSFYAPGWCGEIRKVIFSDTGTVTVVYRITVRGTDGEAHREATGTASLKDVDDPVIIAEQRAFCSACARFGLGLYLYHDDQTP